MWNSLIACVGRREITLAIVCTAWLMLLFRCENDSTLNIQEDIAHGNSWFVRESFCLVFDLFRTFEKLTN